MWMDKAEIAERYRRADNKKEIIKILAQLNGVSEQKIKILLYDSGAVTEDIFKTPEGSVSSYAYWTQDETELLVKLRDKDKMKYVDIAKLLPGRRPTGCRVRYNKVMKERKYI